MVLFNRAEVAVHYLLGHWNMATTTIVTFFEPQSIGLIALFSSRSCATVANYSDNKNIAGCNKRAPPYLNQAN